MPTKTVSVIAILACLGAPSLARAEGLKAVVFDIEPVEEAKTPEMMDRLKKEGDLLRKLLTEKGITIVDTTPQSRKIADNLPLSQCNGCDQDIAKALGADIEVATAVQPASAVTFNLSGSIKDVATNRTLRSGVVDVHGTGDEYWAHGIKFLVKERLLEPPLPNTAEELRKVVETMPKPKE